MKSGSRDDKGSNQELVSLKGLGAREQDPKSRQMAYQASSGGQQRDHQLSDPQITRLWEELRRWKEKNEYAMEGERTL